MNLAGLGEDVEAAGDLQRVSGGGCDDDPGLEMGRNMCWVGLKRAWSVAGVVLLLREPDSETSMVAASILAAVSDSSVLMLRGPADLLPLTVSSSMLGVGVLL